jgi:O-antigen/teichoic acid export membrane protein
MPEGNRGQQQQARPVAAAGAVYDGRVFCFVMRKYLKVDRIAAGQPKGGQTFGHWFRQQHQQLVASRVEKPQLRFQCLEVLGIIQHDVHGLNIYVCSKAVTNAAGPFSVSLKKNLAYNFLLSLSQVLFPLLSIPWLSRVLEPAGLGKVAFVDGLTYYFIVLAEGGIVAHAIRAVARCRNDAAALKQLVSELLSLHLLSTGCALLLYSVTVFLLYGRIDDPRLLYFSFSFLLLNGFACEWYFWGREEFRYITIRSLLVRALALLSLYLLVRQPDHYVRYYAIIVSSAVAILVLNLSRMISTAGISFRNLRWKKHLRITRITYAVSLVYSIPLLLDNVLLGVLSGPAAVAIYAYALKIVRLLAAFLTDAFLVLYPRTVAQLKDSDEAGAKRNLRLSADGLLLLALPAAAGLWLAADAFTSVYFGPRFALVAPHLRILSIFPLLMAGALFLNKQVLLPRDREALLLKGLIAGTATFAFVALWLCPGQGSRGMAWAILAGEGVVLLCNLYFSLRYYPGLLQVNGRAAAAAIIAAASFFVIGILLSGLDLLPVYYLCLLVPACVLAWWIILLLFRLEVVQVAAAFFSRKSKTAPLG